MALIVLYRTTSADLGLINKLSECKIPLVVFNNGISSEIKREIQELNLNDLVWLGDGNNVGLSAAYNIAFEYAKHNGYTHVYLFDQDSAIESDYVSVAHKNLVQLDSRNFGILAPQILYGSQQHKERRHSKIERVSWAISSGSLVAVKAVDSVGGFDERYFIDRVDAEFCYRIREKGYIIYKSGELLLSQRLGYKFQSAFGPVDSHSPLRHYYISRNRCLFYFKTCRGWRPGLYLKFLLSTLKHLVSIVLLEDEKAEKLSAIASGLRDYSRSSFGMLK